MVGRIAALQSQKFCNAGSHSNAIKYDFNHFQSLIALAGWSKDFFVSFVRTNSYKLVEVNRLSVVIMSLTLDCHINPRASKHKRWAACVEDFSALLCKWNCPKWQRNDNKYHAYSRISMVSHRTSNIAKRSLTFRFLNKNRLNSPYKGCKQRFSGKPFKCHGTRIDHFRQC